MLIGEIHATSAKILCPVVGGGDPLARDSDGCCRCQGSPACEDLSPEKLAGAVLLRGEGERRADFVSGIRRGGVAQNGRSGNRGRRVGRGQDLSRSKLWNKSEVVSGNGLFRQDDLRQSRDAGGQPFSLFVVVSDGVHRAGSRSWEKRVAEFSGN